MKLENGLIVFNKPSKIHDPNYKPTADGAECTRANELRPRKKPSISSRASSTNSHKSFSQLLKRTIRDYETDTFGFGYKSITDQACHILEQAATPQLDETRDTASVSSEDSDAKLAAKVREELRKKKESLAMRQEIVDLVRSWQIVPALWEIHSPSNWFHFPCWWHTLWDSYGAIAPVTSFETTVRRGDELESDTDKREETYRTSGIKTPRSPYEPPAGKTLYTILFLLPDLVLAPDQKVFIKGDNFRSGKLFHMEKYELRDERKSVLPLFSHRTSRAAVDQVSGDLLALRAASSIERLRREFELYSDDLPPHIRDHHDAVVRLAQQIIRKPFYELEKTKDNVEVDVEEIEEAREATEKLSLAKPVSQLKTPPTGGAEWVREESTPKPQRRSCDGREFAGTGSEGSEYRRLQEVHYMLTMHKLFGGPRERTEVF